MFQAVGMASFLLKSVVLFCFAAMAYGETLRFNPRGPQKPDFGQYYTASGYIILPYAEIHEPFTAAFDLSANKSRIDYYNGMDKTFQRADMKPYGKNFKIAPMWNEAKGLQTACFVSNGTAPGPSRTAGGAVSIQSILPDISSFQYLGTEMQEGKTCDKWQMKNVVNSRLNTYTLWVAGGVPVKYDMIGYDTLMGSHYDRYYILYKQFNKSRPSAATFDVPNNSTCGGFPGPGVAGAHELFFNPMREFVAGVEDHLEPLFQVFKAQHGRSYHSASKEHAQRREHFRQNVRFVHSKNRAGLTFRSRLNRMADLSEGERRRMRGYRHTPGYNGGLPFPAGDLGGLRLPASLDWRIPGAVTPVKDQAICGSCWSFGSTGTLEGSYFLKHGVRVRLSQQQLMDCSWGFGNNACDGGEDFRSYAYVMKYGLSTEDAYGPYLGNDGRCHANLSMATLHISGFVNVTTNNPTALKTALFKNGPISVSIDASHKSLSFYDHGVYYEPACGNKPDQLDHSVLAVGYGVLNGQAYWLIKNSWSFYWGNDGYVLMAQKDNNCGVMTTPTYALVK